MFMTRCPVEEGARGLNCRPSHCGLGRKKKADVKSSARHVRVMALKHFVFMVHLFPMETAGTHVATRPEKKQGWQPVSDFYSAIRQVKGVFP